MQKAFDERLIVAPFGIQPAKLISDDKGQLARGTPPTLNLTLLGWGRGGAAFEREKRRSLARGLLPTSARGSA